MMDGRKVATLMWTDVASLNWGSDRQRDAYQAMIALDVLSVLAEFDPVLTGAYPLGLETPHSALRLSCYAEDLDDFSVQVKAAYGNLDEFHVVRRERNSVPTVVCRFQFRSFPMEIVAQPRPVEEQDGYRKMLAEAALLRDGGDEARAAIRQLMQEGVKAERAFGQYFRLEGEPGDALLAVADMHAGEVADVVLTARYLRRGTGLPSEPVGEAWS